MTLTVKQMDDINILLTEVSLELLGNSFFDIYGQKCNSLALLCTTNREPESNYDETRCDLLCALGLDAEGSGHEKSQSKRMNRHSESTSAEKPIITTQSLPLSDSIRNRRKAVYSDKAPPTLISRSHDREENRRMDSNSNMNDELSVEDQIKLSVDIEHNRMIYQSDRMKEKHFQQNKSRMDTDYLDEYEIVQEYHNSEREALMSESSSLIEFIKFIKSDPQNSHKMGEIAANILHVKDQL